MGAVEFEYGLTQAEANILYISSSIENLSVDDDTNDYYRTDNYYRSDISYLLFEGFTVNFIADRDNIFIDSTKGYFAGGDTGSNTATAITDKISFVNSTTAAQASANLSQARFAVPGINSSTNGYFVGGFDVARLATADKLVFSTDTTAAQASANLSQAKYGMGATKSSTSAYFAGGFVTTFSATADKLVFATDTTAAQVSANLSQARNHLPGVSSPTNGYFGGGITSTSVAPFQVVTADKLVFGTDTTAAQASANLSQARAALAAAYTTTNGYFTGGVTASTTEVATTDKLVFSTDTTAAQASANLNQAKSNLAGNQSQINGYFAGGFTGNEVATASKLSFATEITAAQTSANLSLARDFLGATSDATIYSNFTTFRYVYEPIPFTPTGIYGYYAGGSTTAAGAAVATADKLTFETDITHAQTSANISQARWGLFGVNSSSDGYFAGGFTVDDFPVVTADKLVFSTDITAAQASANLSQARESLGSANSLLNGYCAGGNTGIVGTTIVATADKLVFSTDTTAAQGSANLTQARYGPASTNSLTDGYFAGGGSDSSTNMTAATDKIVFSTDTTAAQSSANLSQARRYACGINSLTDGYFIGGSTGTSGAGARVATADKLVFSTDTTAAQASANFSQAKYNLAATGSLYNGYFSGGYTANPLSTTTKLTFATDTTATQTSANLSTSKRYLAGASNTNIYEIVIPPDGPVPPTSAVTPILKYGNNNVTRIDLSVGDIQAEQLQKMTYVAGTKGYVSGGISGGVVATADKIAFFTDTTSAQTSANLTTASNCVGVSNSSTKGYLANDTLANKLVFATDVAVLQSSAVLSQARNFIAGASDILTKGYFCGGSSATVVATTDKVSYSIDVTAAQTSANLSQVRFYATGTNNYTTAGYISGGVSGATAYATTDKIVFSTDITAVQTSANLSQARYQSAGVNGLTNGYIAGGFTLPGAVRVTTADKLVFTTETTAAQSSANISSARTGATGTSEVLTKGYFSGGDTGANPATTTDKLVFATDTTAAQTSANLSLARANGGGTFESPTFILNVQNKDLSYIAGESLLSTNAIYLASGKMFQTQSVNSKSTKAPFVGIAASTALTNEPINVRVEGQLGGYAFSTTGPQYIGWNIQGGTISPTNPYRSISVGTAVNTTTLNIGVQSRSPVNKGYFAGGASGAEVELATTDRILFSTQVVAAQTSASLSQARQSMASISEGVTKGYLAGGETGAAIPVTTGNILTYVTDTSVAGAALPAARAGIAGFSQGNTKGYAAGGYSGADVEIVTGYVVTFATNTFAAVVASNLSQARQNHGSLSDGSIKGYFCGGHTGADLEVATGDRTIFSTDTTAALATSNLSAARANMASISEGTTKGYFLGGETGVIVMVNTCDKLIYATDVTAAQASGNLSQARRNATGVSDGTVYGYASGGENSAGTSVTTGDRIVFSTDTTAVKTSAALTTAKHQCGGISEASL